MIYPMELKIINAGLSFYAKTEKFLSEEMILESDFKGTDEGYYLDIYLKQNLDVLSKLPWRFSVAISVGDYHNCYTVKVCNLRRVDMERWHRDDLIIKRDIDPSSVNIEDIEEL